MLNKPKDLEVVSRLVIDGAVVDKESVDYCAEVLDTEIKSMVRTLRDFAMAEIKKRKAAAGAT